MSADKDAGRFNDSDGKRWYPYPPTGESLRSVTSVTGGTQDKPWLAPWAAKLAAEWTVDNYHRLAILVQELGPKAGRAAFLKEAKAAAERARDLKAAAGTYAHDVIEVLILSKWQEQQAAEDEDDAEAQELNLIPLPPIPDALVGEFIDDIPAADFADMCVEGFMHFCEDHDPEFIAAEMRVFNQPAGIAGTVDWVAFLRKLGITAVGDNKGLALDTPIPTPSGWTTIAAVEVGDEVFAADGSICHVTAKSGLRNRPCYTMRFDDGSSIVCDDEHRWPVVSGDGRRRQERVLTAEEISRTLYGQRQRQHRVPTAFPLQTAEAALPIDPYVLGCWLGDGKATSGEISKPDDELFDLIAERGFKVGPRINAAARCQARTVYGLRTQLRGAGLLGQKNIPSDYLRASIDQRLSLLRGLMDTDGCWNTARNQAVFCSTDKAMGYAVRELALSLGERAIINEVRTHGFGKDVTCWRVVWTPRCFNPFSLPRKAMNANPRSTGRSWRRLITAAEPTVSVPTQCLAVDSPDHTYLCGEQMIPTHNTGKDLSGAREQLAGYRRMRECLMPMGQIEPMPATEVGVILHLRPSHERGYERGYRLLEVSAGDDAVAWNTLRRAVRLLNDRQQVTSKPGRVLYPPLPDGSQPPARIADLDGEGYGRALSPLLKAGLESVADLAKLTEDDVLAIRNAGTKTLDIARRMLADHGLSLAEPKQNKEEVA